MGQVVFLAVAVAIAVHVVRALIAGRPASVTIALVADFIYVFCLWVPALLQNAGLVDSKLARAGFALPPTGREIDHLCLRWALELVVLVGVEFVVWRTRAATRIVQTDDLRDPGQRMERATWILIVVGVIATLVVPAPALEDRADGGQGFGTLMRTFLIVGLSSLIYFRGFGRRWAWLVVIGGVALLVVGNVRSPLLVLACAFAASQLRLGQLRRPIRLVGLLLLVVGFAFVGSVMSNMRANLTRDYGYSFGEVLTQSLQNPWVAPYEAGLDTLDGYRFSERIARFEPAQPLDLANIVLTFVPRNLWESKPDAIAVEFSAKYLNYQASGQFLSPTGYLTLVTGSYLGALLGLAVFALLAALLARRFATSFWYAIILLVVVRFLLGGSSFDIYYGLTLVVPALVCLGLVRLGDALVPRSARPEFRVVAVGAGS